MPSLLLSGSSSSSQMSFLSWPSSNAASKLHIILLLAIQFVANGHGQPINPPAAYPSSPSFNQTSNLFTTQQPPPSTGGGEGQQQQQQSAADELVFVHAIWRHGDRTPIYTYPNDPNQIDAWPQGFAELTTRGMAQHIQLGKFLRRRYVDQLRFLPQEYKSNQIYVISTDTNRTIQSATANLIGMFGPGARWGIDYPDLPEWPSTFIPIPVHTYEFKKDPVGYARTFCQRTIELFDLRTQTPEFQQLNQSSAALLDKISEYAGTRITLDTLWGFIETVNIEKTHGLNPPEWALQILPQTIEINTRLIDFQNGLGMAPFLGVDFAKEMPKMLGGAFIWELIGRMEKKVNCLERGINLTPKTGTDPFTPDQKKTLRPNEVRSTCGWLGSLKYYAHSAHDMTLAALFSTLQFDHVDFDRNGFPGYAACLLLELWKNADGEYYVKVLYRRDNVDELLDLTPHIRGCEQGCSLKQFKQRSIPFKQEPDQETLCKTPLVYRPFNEDQQEWNSAGTRMAHSMATSLFLFASSLLPLLFFISWKSTI